jgi:hypothetical protein
VAWSQTERLIHTAEEADVLLIFDCCFAGKLSGTLDRRSPPSTRIFEFLGATTSNGLTRLPGKESFTRALIWALYELADEKEGFTTSRLYNQILMAPDFPVHEQTPVLSERRGHCLKRLVLAPLKAPPHEEQQVEELSGPSFEASSFKYSLTLQLLFPELPSMDEMDTMCGGLKELLRMGQLKANQIIWRGMYRKGLSPYEISPSARATAFKWLSSLSQKRKRSSSLSSDVLQVPTPVSQGSHFEDDSAEDYSPNHKRRKLEPQE